MINTDEHYKFSLTPLSYKYSDLEPYIDTKTMHLHHDKHLQTYINNLNNILKNYPDLQNFSLEYLIKNYDKLPAQIQIPVKNNSGGIYNHNFYFDIMTPNFSKKSINLISDAIYKKFGSYDNFKLEFKNSALSVFGSGWTWLVLDSKDSNLNIISTANQDTPLTENLLPILLVDVWEHAYYLKYQNLRSEYLDNWFNLINWEKAQLNFIKYYK